MRIGVSVSVDDMGRGVGTDALRDHGTWRSRCLSRPEVPLPIRNVFHYDYVVFEDVDWSHRGDYMLASHGISVLVANDALGDANRVVIDPDYNSVSGRSVRIIGYSMLAGAIVTVIVLSDGGVDYGVNGWLANVKDQRIYREADADGQD